MFGELQAAKIARVLVLSLLAMTASASAGLLNGNASAYNDGNGPAAGAWTGTTGFSTGTLIGTIDWAVFGPGAFPFSGYTTTSGELTYAYQVFITGTAPLSSFTMALTDQADNIGDFTSLAGQTPTLSTLTANTSAAWKFAGIPQGANSDGLAFSSIRVPQNLFGVVVDTGQSQFVVPLPSPSAVSIPEPAVGLLGMGLVAGLVRRRRNV